MHIYQCFSGHSQRFPTNVHVHSVSPAMTAIEFRSSCLLFSNSAACSHSRGSKSNNSSIQRGEKGLLTARSWELSKEDINMDIVTELGKSIIDIMQN